MSAHAATRGIGGSELQRTLERLLGDIQLVAGRGALEVVELQQVREAQARGRLHRFRIRGGGKLETRTCALQFSLGVAPVQLVPPERERVDRTLFAAWKAGPIRLQLVEPRVEGDRDCACVVGPDGVFIAPERALVQPVDGAGSDLR
jgi:hypothetical protein